MNKKVSVQRSRTVPSNGAESLLATFEANDIEVCFANPGTSEMHFVSALDRDKNIRGVLGLFEGVLTGAADGYARMANRPAATLLHLGPGMANGLSNMHNAMRAQSPMVNVIGDHATYHRDLDAPLTSDIEGAARPFSNWVRTTPTADTIGRDTAEAVRVAREGKIASLILPADAAWNELDESTPLAFQAGLSAGEPPIEFEAVEVAARWLQDAGARTAILIGPRSATPEVLASANAIAQYTGASVLHNTSMAVIPRGAGRHRTTQVPYPVARSQELLTKFDSIVLVGAKAPVAFFAYPDKPSRLSRPGTRFIELARGAQRTLEGLESLRETLGAGASRAPTDLKLPGLPSGGITREKLGAFLGHRLPEGAVVVDESITTGRTFLADTQNARPHHWLTGTGGAIGYAMGAAVGAAIASPDQPVVALESDGSGMYMPQALWTQAREQLNVTTLIFSNRHYEILRQEMSNVGVSNFGSKAESLLSLTNPEINWVPLSESMGVPAQRVETMEGLDEAFNGALKNNGPHLIEVSL